MRRLKKMLILVMAVLLFRQAALSVKAADTSGSARDIRNPVPLYLQQDYPNTRYGSGSVETNGCSIVSLAMVATCLTGHEYLPDELAKYFGGRAENNIARLEYASEALRLPYEKAENCRDALSALKDGKLVIALMGEASLFTDTQHFIVLTGITGEGNILVNDPNEPNYHRQELEAGFENGFSENQIIQGFSGAWIYDPDDMPAEPFLYREDLPSPEDSRYPSLELTYEETELLARMIWVEARGEPLEGQQAIAEVVFNRMFSQKFSGTLTDVIYREGQFRCVPYLEDAEPSDTQFEAIEAAVYGPNVLPVNVYYFSTEQTNDNVWGQIGGHIFCYSFGYSEDAE